MEKSCRNAALLFIYPDDDGKFNVEINWFGRAHQALSRTARLVAVP
jgi:hypothetical protein